MVRKENSIYIFVGQDAISKDIKLKRLKQESFASSVEQFNMDILYARDLTLLDLQEKILCLPVKAKKRIIVIKDAEALKKEIKEFILNYVLNFRHQTILVLDISQREPQDTFIDSLARYAQIYHFQEVSRPNAFTLSRWIDLRRADYALKILNQLLRDREKPERILGGLRYTWERSAGHPLERRRRLKLLLNCDIDIKTGRLKAALALEKLVVNLCYLSKSSG